MRYGTIQYGQVWRYKNRHVFILGNGMHEDGSVWVADRRTGHSAHVPTSTLAPVKTRTDTMAELTERCVTWARRGVADAAWWLGWRYEGTQHARSVWYYVAAMRKAPRAYGWAWSRVYSNALTAYMRKGVPMPCIEFIREIAEFQGGKSDDWHAAILRAECAVDVAVAESQCDKAMSLLLMGEPDDAPRVAVQVGIPYRALLGYEPYQAWRDKVWEALLPPNP